MKLLTLILSLIVVIGLISGCAPDQAPADTTQQDATPAEDSGSDSEVTQELDDTVIDDEDLEVGEMI